METKTVVYREKSRLRKRVLGAPVWSLLAILAVSMVVAAVVVGPLFTKTTSSPAGVTLAEKSGAAGDQIAPAPAFGVTDFFNMTSTFVNGFTGAVYLKIELQGLACDASTASKISLSADNPPGGTITYVVLPAKDAAGVACAGGSSGNVWFFDPTYTQSVAGNYAYEYTWTGFPTGGTVTWSISPNT